MPGSKATSRPASARRPARSESALPRDLAAAVATVGAVAAGAALLEIALIPGLAIGAASALAPRVVLGAVRLARPRFAAPERRGGGTLVLSRDGRSLSAPALAAGKLELKQAVLKTITFRVIVTTLDFSTNYFVIGELATAAGLSTFALVAGPIFYFVHETAWNYFGPSIDSARARFPSDAQPSLTRVGGFTMSRALAKTITFRAIATTMDFTATYVVVGDLATALTLSAFGFVAGPFVYFGHERLWDRLSGPAAPPAPVKALPAPARALPAPI
ncbi:MAG: DUF2061 domain-containing protein [Hyphomicrobiales bacterium]|nr:DUF2061 domain-containing protein [Hyphomicrobiales bacterium]